jgi:hypothetical protein
VIRSLYHLTSPCLLFAASLVGCDESAAPPAVPQSVLVRGTVVDSSATPVGGALTMLHVFSPDSAQYWWPSPPPSSITDSLGRFELSWDSLGSGTIDSILIESVAPGCQDLGQVLILPGTAVPPGQAPILDVTISQLEVHPPARTVPGQYCAFGMDPFWGPHAYILALQIDSVSAGNMWGRWHLNWRPSSGNDEGTFVGGAAPTFVVLNLTSDPVWHSCTTMQLYVPVRSTGEWGPATIYGEQDCVPEPAPFTFVADTMFP